MPSYVEEFALGTHRRVLEINGPGVERVRQLAGRVVGARQQVDELGGFLDDADRRLDNLEAELRILMQQLDARAT
ncbi:hypothetical protein [Sagittula sp. SSi028]|uniref:hypothetical protein n=1 Tax=Sagittula sp. SSi028 TaxID=3400636 RepID=UPI003AF589F4